MTTKILLINPPIGENLEGFPSNLPQMKSWVERKEGVECTIRDLSSVDPDDIEANLRDHLDQNTQYAGITITTATYQSGLKVARAVKRINPNTKVILGGHHVKESQEPSGQYKRNGWEEYQSEAEVVLALDNSNKPIHPEIDIIALGEGERTLDALLEGKSLFEVPGVAYRTGFGIMKNPLAPRLNSQDLDSISIADFGEESLESMRQFGNPNLITATGCPLGCSFCSVGREKVISKSVEKKIKELYVMIEKFPNVQKEGRISIQDNFFAQSKKGTKSLCNAIIQEREENPNFYFNWDCQTRVESVKDLELTELMAQAGCVAVYLGVENFSQEVLEYLNKAHDIEGYLEHTKRAISNILDSKMEAYIDFQTGMPLEEERHREENIRALREIGQVALNKGGEITVFMSLSVIYPGTNLAYQMFSDGVPRNSFDVYTEWEDTQDELKQYLGRHFAHGNGGIPLGIMNKEEFKEGKIVIEKDKVREINSYLSTIRNIEGINLYTYR